MAAKGYRVEIYRREDGRFPFKDWFVSLADSRIQPVVDARIARMRAGGLEETGSVGEGVLEQRLDFGSGLFIYFAEQKERRLIVLCGGDRSSRLRDINRTRENLKELRAASSAASSQWYKEFLSARLQGAPYSASYLNACLKESEEVFFIGLRDAIAANGGMAGLTRSTGLKLESLYRILSRKTTPKLSNIQAILNPLGIQLEFTPQQDKDEAA